MTDALERHRLLVTAFPIQEDGSSGDAVVELDLNKPQHALCGAIGVALTDAALKHGALDVTIEVQS